VLKRQAGAIRTERPKRVIIDCDPGGDDAQALILAIHLAKKYGIEILGVTVVAGNASL
jgi:purine nucleosidase